MMTKIFVLIGALVAVCSAGIVPAVPAALPAAFTVGTYASSYNAHAINHALAAPYIAAPAVAAAPAFAASPVAYSPLSAAAYAYPAAPFLAGRR
ncbi:hypothetical protein M0802_005360 [Mischocyttarus mexicanus]|nr:hypothetical protein M0802_005360 [Mischocyttarus mexicanus]